METLGSIFMFTGTAAATAVGLGATLFSKNRLLTTVNNKTDVDRFVKFAGKRGESPLGCYGRFVDNAWVPTYWCSLYPMFFSKVDVVSSEYDITQQVVDVSLSIPCWVSWDTFLEHTLHDGGKKNNKQQEDGKEDALPNALARIAISSPLLAWPDWSVKDDEKVFPDNTPESELALADRIAEDALEVLRKRNVTSGIFVVTGAPQTGKTSAGLRLAQKLGADTIVARDYRPTQAGHMVRALERVRNDYAGKEGYLVIILDEFDRWMMNFPLPQHNKLHTEVMDKDSWNVWADQIHLKDKVIVWMTTNDNVDDADKYDPALLRPKRVTMRYDVADQSTFEANASYCCAKYATCDPPLIHEISDSAHMSDDDDGESVRKPLLDAREYAA